MSVKQGQFVAVPQKRNGRAFRQFDADAIRENALNAGGFDPREFFQLGAPCIERNAEHAAIAVAREGLKDFGAGAGAKTQLRTERDMPIVFVLGGSLLLAIFLAVAPKMPMQGNFLAAILVVIFGFLFVTVSSRITGLIGTSSNPISGMTVATLLLTCLIFLAMGQTGAAATLTAMTVAAIVCVASSNGGTCSAKK